MDVYGYELTGLGLWVSFYGRIYGILRADDGVYPWLIWGGTFIPSYLPNAHNNPRARTSSNQIIPNHPMKW